jgi:hypothetical protein
MINPMMVLYDTMPMLLNVPLTFLHAPLTFLNVALLLLHAPWMVFKESQIFYDLPLPFSKVLLGFKH